MAGNDAPFSYLCQLKGVGFSGTSLELFGSEPWGRAAVAATSQPSLRRT
jgi:hypothetical protein